MKSTIEVLLVDSDPLRTVSLCDHHAVVVLKQGNALHTNDQTPSSEDCEMCDTDVRVETCLTVAGMIAALEGVEDKSVPVVMCTPEQAISVTGISVDNDDPDDHVVWIMGVQS